MNIKHNGDISLGHFPYEERTINENLPMTTTKLIKITRTLPKIEFQKPYHMDVMILEHLEVIPEPRPHSARSETMRR